MFKQSILSFSGYKAEKKGSPTQSLFSKPFRKDVVSGDSEELVNVKAWEWSEAE